MTPNRGILRNLAVVIIATIAIWGPRLQTAQASEPDPPFTLYVQVKTQEQLEGAKSLQQALEEGPTSQRIIVPEPQLRSDISVTTTEVRCMARSDCERVGEVVAAIERVIEGTVRIHDMTREFEGMVRSDPYVYELRFGDGPVRFREDPSQKVQIPDESLRRSINASMIERIEPVGPVVPGDEVFVRLSEEARGDNSFFVVSLDELPARVTADNTGFSFVVPEVDRDLFTTREVPIQLVFGNRWQVTADERLSVAPAYTQYLVPLGILATLLLGGIFLTYRYILNIRRESRARLEEALSADRERLRKLEIALEEPADHNLPIPEPPEKLVEYLNSNKFVLYFGRDITEGENSPSYKQVLGRIAAQQLSDDELDQIKALLERNDTDTVVRVLERKVGNVVLRQAILAMYHDLVPRHLEALLSSACYSGIINASFTPIREIIEKSVTHISPASDYDFVDLLQGRSPFLLELFRNPEDATQSNFTTYEVAAALDQTPSLRQSLSALFASQRILFSGVTAESIFEALETLGIRKGSSQTHYALIVDRPGLEYSATRLKEQYGIEVIPIGSPEHVGAFMGKLLEHADAGVSKDQRREAPSQPKIGSIRLKNVGPFTDIEVEFRDDWTVLLGNNGTGKSTILKALAFALAGADRQIDYYARGLLRRADKGNNDKKQAQQRTGSIEITLLTHPTPTTYTTELLEGPGGRVTVKASTTPFQAGTLSAFGYPALRGVPPRGPISSIGSDGNNRPDATDLIPLISGIDERGKSLREWIMRCDARSNDPKASQMQKRNNRQMLESLFQLVSALTHGYSIKYAGIDPQTSEVLLETADGELPLDFLSQGLASTLGWAGPLIQRLYEIKGAEAVPEHEHAILLIDEIDSHLHPEWQQKLVPALKEYFPNLQVIATTHSPLMVGNLDENEVLRVIRTEDGQVQVEHIEQSFIGYRFDQILTDRAFGLERARAEIWTARDEYLELTALDSLNDEQEARLTELETQIEQLPGPFETPDEWEAARESRARLDQELAKFKSMRIDSDSGNEEVPS